MTPPVTFPATRTRRSVLVVELAASASVISTVTIRTSTPPMYPGPVRINHSHTRRVPALLVSLLAFLGIPNQAADIRCSRHAATSLNYEDDVTFCPDGSYCCGNNNTACCSSNGGKLEVFYRNPGTIPSATAWLPGYYSSLQVSTKSRSTTISSSPTSTQSHTIPSPFATATATATATTTTTTPTPTGSTPTPSPTSASHDRTGNGDLTESARVAIGVVIPVMIVVASFVTWWFCGRRRSHKTAGPPDENSERHSTGVDVPDLSHAGELSSGLDRAELVTKQWDSTELPTSHELFELAVRS